MYFMADIFQRRFSIINTWTLTIARYGFMVLILKKTACFVVDTKILHILLEIIFKASEEVVPVF